MGDQAMQTSAVAKECPDLPFSRGRTVVLLNLLLAVVVMVKDLLLAAYLGASWQADAFFLAIFLPDAIGSNVLANALATAWVPAFVAMRVSGKLRSKAICSYALPVGLGCILLAGLLLWLREPILSLVAARLGPTVWELAVALFAIALPVVILYPLTAIASGLIQAHQSFVLPAVGPIVLNVFQLATLIVLHQIKIPLGQGVHLLIGAQLLAAVCTLLLMAVGAHKVISRRWAEQSPPEEAAAKPESPGRRLIPLLTIAASTQLMLLGERFWAGSQGEGALSALNYAYRLAQFPLWTFVAALAMVALPILSLRAEGKATEEMNRLAEDGMDLALLLTLPAGLVLSTLSKPIVTLLMQHGSFDLSSATLTARILASYALSLTPAAMVLIGQRLLLARGQMLIPAISCVVTSVITFVVDGWLVARLGAPGLGYGATCSASLNACVIVGLLSANGLKLGTHLRSQTIRLLLAHLPLTIVLLGCARIWPLVEGLGRPSHSLWLLGTSALLFLAWLAGLTRTRLLQPVLDFMGPKRHP